MRRYTDSYTYDAVGNLRELRAVSGSTSSVARAYRYATDSNRLLGTSRSGDAAGVFSDSYSDNARGAMTSLPHLFGITLDFRDQMRRMVLDAGGQQTQTNTTTERQTLHVLDDQARVAMVAMVGTFVRSGGAAVVAPVPRWRFQLGNHLGSASLELDAALATATTRPATSPR